MGKNSAEYMRAYRARKKAEHAVYDANKPLIGQLKTELGEARRFTTEYATLANDRLREIEQLEEEVRHLKAELAKQSAEPAMNPHKTSQRAIDRAKEFLLLSAEPGDLAYTRKAQQAQRDRILRRVNRGG